MKRLWTVILCAGLFAPLHAATKGSCESEAVSIDMSSAGATRTVTLVAEYEKDEDGAAYNPNSGVYYFKTTLKRLNAYTIWTEGLTTNDEIQVWAYAKDPKSDDDDGSSADFDEIDEIGGNQRLIMYADNWYIDEEDKKDSDPKEWTYYITLTGEPGQTVTINFQKGVVIPIGREERPRSITPGTAVSKIESQLQLGGEYYFRARLTGGRLYWFGTSGGTTNNIMSINVQSADSDSEESAEADVTIYNDAAFDGDEGNCGVWVVPDETDTFTILVDGMGDSELAPFGLSYKLVPSRTVKDHPSTALTTENGFECEFQAGRQNALELGFYDLIIDESLFRFTVEKGSRYLVATEGASTNLLMRVYDAKGNVVAENTGDGEGFNVRCAFEATASGTYYAGVCQNLTDEFNEECAYTTARIRVSDASPVEGSPDAWEPRDSATAGATPLSPLPGKASDAPEAIDVKGNGPHAFDATDWTDVFMIAGRKGITYALRAAFVAPTFTSNTLRAEVFTLSSSKEKAVAFSGDVNPESDAPLSFTATANTTYYIRLTVAQGHGLEYPPYRLHALAYSSAGAALGILTVNTWGATAGAFSLGSETVKYPGGNSVLVSGTQQVKFAAVKGFTTPAAQTVTVAPGTEPTVVEAYYRDTFDPKDDTPKGATGWALKNVETTFARTLWGEDPEDSFSFTTKDGQYYDFALRDIAGDAVFTITNATADADHPDGVFADRVTSVSHLVLPATKTKYYLTVSHGTAERTGGAYTLAGFLANVGTIAFAKAAVSAKETAASVAVQVKRTAKDGRVRVKYGTVAGTARPGVDYIAQNGILEWAANDNKPKTITVKLIPDLLPVYEGDKTFAVELRPMDDEELEDDEYPATLAGDTCTVTLKEASKVGTTAEMAYAKKAPKLAKVKTEQVGLGTGMFFGVLAEDGCALTNGFPKYASITFTASAANPAKLSAKVSLAGKTYTFTAKGWDVADEFGCEKEFALAQKVNGVTYTNTLRIAIASGATGNAGEWLRAGGEVELEMNVPDANGKGVQDGIRYLGNLYRQNAKIQDYFAAVTNFTGYYTVALAPDAWIGSGVPAGNGYLTLTIDNKGTVKAAGVLADGSTKVALSVPAAAIRPDAASANGYSLHVPLFFAKKPCCFGGELRLFAREDGTVVVDSASLLGWYNDNAALTYDNADGFVIELTPVGGWYDQVINLQAHYLNYALEIGTADSAEFPSEAVPDGYVLSEDALLNGLPVDVLGDKISTAKKVQVKNGKLIDLATSVNPCNVQVKFARATGLVTGSFSVWTVSDDGLRQKEVKGLKHAGVLLLARDDAAPIADEIVSAGYFTQQVTVTDENPDTGKVTKRKWTFSAPFNVLGIDQGDPDWWADDWGEEPLEL